MSNSAATTSSHASRRAATSPQRPTSPRQPARSGQAKTAADVMTMYPVCAELSATIEQVAELLSAHEISGLPVVDRHDRVVGVVSKSDLLRRVPEGAFGENLGYLFELARDLRPTNHRGPVKAVICAQDFMTPHPITASPETPLDQIAKLMCENRIHRIIVVDDERFPIGIITSLDILSCLAA